MSNSLGFWLVYGANVMSGHAHILKCEFRAQPMRAAGLALDSSSGKDNSAAVNGCTHGMQTSFAPSSASHVAR